MQVIAHNLESQFANRQLNTTAKEKAKSTEKLSSGYRINRSADDAAGLQISEKMRWQIRGLDKTVDNCEAGSSFCEVADGAMQQMEDILHRMRELSVQAANDTNTLVDRQAIQNEMNALVVEVNRITSDTEFNTLSVFGWERSATNYKPDPANPGGWIVSGPPTTNVVTGTNYGLGEILGPGKIYDKPKLNDKIKFDIAGGWEITGKNQYTTTYGTGNTKSGTTDTLVKEIEKYMPNANITAAELISGTAGDIDRYEVDAAGVAYHVSIKFDQGTQMMDGKYPAQFIKLEKGTFAIPGDPTSFVPEDTEFSTELVQRVGSTAYDNGKDYGAAWMDFSGLGTDFNLSDLYGQGFNSSCATCSKHYSISFTGDPCTQTTPNGTNYSYSGSSSSPCLEINLSGCTTGTEIVERIMDAVNNASNFNNHYTQYAVNQTEPGKLYILDNRNSEAGGGISTFEPAKRNKDGQLEVGGEVIVNKGDPPTDRVVYANKNMWIQSGTTNMNGFFMERPLLSAGILGIMGLSVLDFEAASTSIDSCDAALTILNEERTKIGAQQNRLESAILVNANTEENTQAAESRLRDTDMAEEMVNYSKSSILEQAGQAMLAQANQSKQGILSLFS